MLEYQKSLFSSSCSDYQDSVSGCQQHPDKDSEHNSVMNDLAERLKRERERKGWSQVEFAKNSGVKQSFIGALEARNQENSSRLPELAHALGVDAYWLKTGNCAQCGFFFAFVFVMENILHKINRILLTHIISFLIMDSSQQNTEANQPRG